MNTHLSNNDLASAKSPVVGLLEEGRTESHTDDGKLGKLAR